MSNFILWVRKMSIFTTIFLIIIGAGVVKNDTEYKIHAIILIVALIFVNVIISNI